MEKSWGGPWSCDYFPYRSPHEPSCSPGQEYVVHRVNDKKKWKYSRWSADWDGMASCLVVKQHDGQEDERVIDCLVKDGQGT